ncbi:MAG: DEAD/DEAH box helicase [Candidatus Omnitrophota bacterium]
MLLNKIVSQFDLPQGLVDSLEKSGVKKLYPFQISALKKGILKKKNLVLALPTASGKTLIAELCMVKNILENKGNSLCLYIVPLKALASEKYEDFKSKYEPLGIKVGIATGDFDIPSIYLARYNILIATSEKVDSLLRFRAKWLTKLLNIVVLDEIHFIDDRRRGPTLEILTSRLKQLNKNIQFLALSATIKNADEIAGWLDAELIYSDWRPVPLKEGVFYLNSIDFPDGSSRKINVLGIEELNAICLDTIKENGQALVFVNSRRSTQAVARNLCKQISNHISAEEKRVLKELADKIETTLGESTKICRQLAHVVRSGVAFHHAGLHYKQRKLIEQYFKQNFIKVICSTPTLAAGVNLPARRVIIRDYKRYQAGLGSVPIPVFEYKQCAGRAGRPKYDKLGESVLMTKTLNEFNTVLDEYINAAPEPITSKLGSEEILRTHILSSVASGYVYDVNGMFEFLSHTFLSYQKKTQDLIEIVSSIFEFLESNDLILRKGFRFYPTAFGSLVSRLYIDPVSGIALRNGLKKINGTKTITEMVLFYLICSCADMELLTVNKSDYEKLDIFSGTDGLLAEALNDSSLVIDSETSSSILKTSWMLFDWINEEKEDIICDRFNVGPGDIHRLLETTGWLVYCAGSIAKLFDFKNTIEPLINLRQRIKYGIKDELINLVLLRGIGRVRARNLYKKGFRQLSDIKDAQIQNLIKVPRIAENLAKDLKHQISKLKI